MWTSARTERKRAAAATEAVLAVMGGRVALEARVRACLEATYRRRLSARDVRARSNGVISFVREGWERHSDPDSHPRAEFIRARFSEWEEEVRASTQAGIAESIFAGLGWGGVVALVLYRWNVLYAVAVGVLLTVLVATMWPRLKRRGRAAEWGDH